MAEKLRKNSTYDCIENKSKRLNLANIGWKAVRPVLVLPFSHYASFCNQQGGRGEVFEICIPDMPRQKKKKFLLPIERCPPLTPPPPL
jgi:hypothetical protein